MSADPSLPEFLLARIADDEAEVRLVTDRDPILPGDRGTWRGGLDDLNVLLSPIRALAECEAKRRLVTECAEILAADPHETSDVAFLAGDVLDALALPYADHPDFREEWRS